MSGGGEQPDILSVGILVKERWKVVSMPSYNSFSPLKIFLLGYWIQSASDYLSPFWKSLRHLLETSQIVRLVTSYRMLFQDLAALPSRNEFRLLYCSKDLFMTDLYPFDCVPILALP